MGQLCLLVVQSGYRLGRPNNTLETQEGGRRVPNSDTSILLIPNRQSGRFENCQAQDWRKLNWRIFCSQFPTSYLHKFAQSSLFPFTIIFCPSRSIVEVLPEVRNLGRSEMLTFQVVPENCPYEAAFFVFLSILVHNNDYYLSE